jgi:hypothetical protein
MATSCVAGSDVATVTTDPELLLMEFEAIVAANYPSSEGRVLRRPPVVRSATASRSDPHGAHSDTHTTGGSEVRTVRRRPRARERSPPAPRPAPSTGS